LTLCVNYDGDRVAGSTADTAKAEAMTASNAVPMMGSAGMAATKSGETASTNKEGGGQYSPSQPTDDWADNLKGVKQLMTTTQPAPPPVPPPPPPPPPPPRPPLLVRRRGSRRRAARGRQPERRPGARRQLPLPKTTMEHPASLKPPTIA
jgi:hypothetical protein